jgi:5'-3' exonuclease
MLVDAANLYFRAFYALPDSITAPDGRPVNAIRGFLDMSAALIERRHPTRWVACLDTDWRPAFRVALVPSYKAHRVAADGGEDVPAALAAQVPLLLDTLGALGLCAVGADGYEADDVMATLAARDGEAVEVVSGDRDMVALVTDRVRLLYTGRGLAKLEDLGPREVQAKYGIPATNYADFAVLRGDPSDGLPGVPGVGEKTAAALVSRFGTIEEILAAAAVTGDGFPAGAANRVLAARDYLAIAPTAVRPRTDVPIDPLDDRLPGEAADPDRLAALVEELGIRSSVQRIQAAIALAAAGNGSA